MKKLCFLIMLSVCTMATYAATVSVAAGENALETAVAAAASGDVLELGDGTFTEWSSITLDKQLTIKAAEGAKPVIKIYSFKFSAGSEGSVIDGLEVENLSNDNYLFCTGGNVAGSLTFKNCVMHNKKAETTNPTPYFYLSSNTVETLTIDNCIFTDNDKTEGAIVYGSSATVTNFNMTNSTAYNMPNDLAIRMEHLTNAYVDHCTFYNCGTRVLYLKGMTTSLVQNCVVANPTETSKYCIAAYSGEVKNIVYYNTTAPHSGSTNTGCKEADPKFKDAANTNFNFAFTSPLFLAATDGTHIGDPRWTVEAGEDAIAIPGSLPLDAAVLNGTKISKSAEAISWSENDTQSTASFVINAAKDGSYNVVLTETTSSGHNYKVSVIDVDGNVLSVAEGENTWKLGDIALGQIDIAAPGNYLVRLENLTSYSASSVSAIKFDYLGGAVVDIPATLPNEDAVLIGPKIKLTTDGIAWNDNGDASADYAVWNISATAAGSVDVTLNIGTPSSGHCFTVGLYEGDVLKASTSETSTVYTTGPVAVGTLVIPAAGNYTVRLTNSTEWSSAIVESVTMTAAVEPDLVTLEETASDNTVLSTYKTSGETVDVQLTRTLVGNDYNTFCLPFSLSSAQLAAAGLEGAEILQLASASLEGTVLYLDFSTQTSIYQGAPYLVKPLTDVVNPVFENVVIAIDEGAATHCNPVWFISTFVKTTVEASENSFVLGSGGSLYYTGYDIALKGYRAYFKIAVPSPSGMPKRMEIRNKPGTTTDLQSMESADSSVRKAIENGRVVIRVDGKTYNMMGTIE